MGDVRNGCGRISHHLPFPRITKAVPSPLVAIIIITIISVATGAHVNTVGDLGHLSQSLPSFFIPNVPINLETLRIIFPYSLGIAVVGLIESLLTAQIVDDLTDTGVTKIKRRVVKGLPTLFQDYLAVWLAAP